MKLPFRIQRLHIFTGDDGTTAVVAFDPGDAVHAYEEWSGVPWDDSYEPLNVQIPDKNIIRIINVDGDIEEFKKSRPPFSKFGMGNYYPHIEAPAWLWCLWNGRGFLYSTEF
ncbi:MAG TPA: hypothetical protein DCZ08_00370 [Anaerolineaceae bacterium]|nr:hypothetical protein [Anaerolineaceae bacterium]